jgi:hypothetical protein
MLNKPPQSFAETKFRWLDQVADDHSLPPICGFLAIVLLRYFSRTYGGWAWPATARLAADLKVSDRTVQKALHAMSPKHLSIKWGGGRHATNQFRINLEGTTWKED